MVSRNRSWWPVIVSNQAPSSRARPRYTSMIPRNWPVLSGRPAGTAGDAQNHDEAPWATKGDPGRSTPSRTQHDPSAPAAPSRSRRMPSPRAVARAWPDPGPGPGSPRGHLNWVAVRGRGRVGSGCAVVSISAFRRWPVGLRKHKPQTSTSLASSAGPPRGDARLDEAHARPGLGFPNTPSPTAIQSAGPPTRPEVHPITTAPSHCAGAVQPCRPRPLSEGIPWEPELCDRPHFVPPLQELGYQ